MIEAVGDLDRVLACEPGDPLADQAGEGGPIHRVALHDGNAGADFSLEEQHSCQSQGQDHLDDDHEAEGEVAVVPVLLFQVAYPEMDEDVQKFGAGDDQH